MSYVSQYGRMLFFLFRSAFASAGFSILLRVALIVDLPGEPKCAFGLLGRSELLLGPKTGKRFHIIPWFLSQLYCSPRTVMTCGHMCGPGIMTASRIAAPGLGPVRPSVMCTYVHNTAQPLMSSPSPSSSAPAPWSPQPPSSSPAS